MTELTNKLMSEKFFSKEDIASEIINLEAILRLPKGTEYFLSDLHGEFDAFCHLMNNCSGVIREKIGLLFCNILSENEQNELATIIYYPREKIEQIKHGKSDLDSWFSITLYRMVEVVRELSRKYTRSKVRKSMPKSLCYIIEEMLYSLSDSSDKAAYYDELFLEIVRLNMAESFVYAISDLIKRLAIDHLHIVGDVFDRGAHPEKIMDMLMQHHSIDIEWGNHDILWIGAAAGSAICTATVIENCLKYGNSELLEIGYGISLRELALFADKQAYDPKFSPKLQYPAPESECIIMAKMRKAIFHIMLKLQHKVISSHKSFEMQHRDTLQHISMNDSSVTIDGKQTPIIDVQDFDYLAKSGLDLTNDEQKVVNFLVKSFTESEKLARHYKFLIEKGSIYTVYNGNLIFHGCIPLDEKGQFREVIVHGKPLKGKALMDKLDQMVRAAALSKDAEEKDIFWYLWCGTNSPLFGRDKLAIFESIYVPDKSFSKEKKDYYYTLSRDAAVAKNILREFGLDGEHSHIINGHIPVQSVKGESPIKADGKLLVIDGGFCNAYHSKTGIAGYTLIYNSRGMKLAAHSPFVGTSNAIASNTDIVSDINVFEVARETIKVSECDNGKKIQGQIAELKQVLQQMK